MFADSAFAGLAAPLRSGPDALYTLLAQRLKRKPGYDLLTILAPGDAGDRLTRLYTSNAQQYPLGDADIVENSAWFRQIFVEKKPVIGNDEQEIRLWLPDFADLAAMGYGSLLNLPIVIAGETVGIVNVMAASGHFSADTIEAIAGEIPLAALAVLARDVPLRKLTLP